MESSLTLGIPAYYLLFAAFCFLLAGTVKGTVGVGLPTVVMGTTTLLLDPRIAVVLLLWPIFLTNIWQVWRMGQFVETVRRYRFFIGFLVLFVFLTALFAGSAPARLLYAAAGGMILAFLTIELLVKPPRLPDRWDKPAQMVLGTLAGLFGGLTSMWAVPTAIYLASRQVDKDAFVRGTGVLLLTGSVALMAGFLGQSWVGETKVTAPLLLASIAMTLPAIAGFQIGERIRARISRERFMTVLYIVFFVLGMNLLRRAIFG